MAATDRTFTDKAAQGGMAEFELGRLAEQNAQSQEVKDFGKRMIEDYSTADQLKQLASQGGRDSACRNEREGQRYQGAAVAIAWRGLR
jgi:putative membrane protein